MYQRYKFISLYREHGTDQNAGFQGETTEDWDSECLTEEEIQRAYYQLSVPLEHVIIVDSRDGFQQCLTSITRPGSIIGIDSEWKPGFTGGTQRFVKLAIFLL